MDIVQLTRMANQIGAFFAAMPHREQAIDDIASHLQKFWEPRMRRALLAFLDQHPDGRGSDASLDAIVVQAVDRHRQALTPAAPAA